MGPTQKKNAFLDAAFEGLWFLIISTVITFIISQRLRAREDGVASPKQISDPQPDYDELKGSGEGALAFVYAWAMYFVLVDMFFRVMADCEPDPQIKIPYPRYCLYQLNASFAVLFTTIFVVWTIVNKISFESSWWVLTVHALQNKAFCIITGWGWYCYVASQIHHTASLNLRDDAEGMFQMTGFLLVLFYVASIYIFNLYMAIHRDLDDLKSRPTFSEHQYLKQDHESVL